MKTEQINELKNNIIIVGEFDIGTGHIQIFEERVSQILKHKRSAYSDVTTNPSGELLVAAKALMKDIPRHSDFPIHWQVQACDKMMRKSKKERLVIAGALIAAEIDRLNYLENQVKSLNKD